MKTTNIICGHFAAIQLFVIAVMLTVTCIDGCTCDTCHMRVPPELIDSAKLFIGQNIDSIRHRYSPNLRKGEGAWYGSIGRNSILRDLSIEECNGSVVAISLRTEGAYFNSSSADFQYSMNSIICMYGYPSKISSYFQDNLLQSVVNWTTIDGYVVLAFYQKNSTRLITENSTGLLVLHFMCER